MRRIRWYLLCVLALVPHHVSALGLHWIGGGGEDLTFVSATRCTLVVEAGEGLAQLPAEWRLVWVADGCEVRPLAMSAPGDCPEGAAGIVSVSGRGSPADFAGNLITAEFCSAGGPSAMAAWFTLDLPAGSSGKLKVVALDPLDPDSTRVLESPVVRFNGGVTVGFPPVLLRAAVQHPSTDYRLTAVGANLSATQSLSLVAPDGSWQQPLAIDGRTDNLVTAGASLAASVPTCVVQAVSDSGGIGPVEIPGEPEPELTIFEPEGGSCQETFLENVLPLRQIQPKDFSFVLGGWTPAGAWTFHLFYIRQNRPTVAHPELHGGLDATE